MKKALYGKIVDDKKKTVQCFLCPHCCVIAVNREGICRIRRNVDGVLTAMLYKEYSGIHLDPIEKKPLYHFYPGKSILSLGTLGCNFSCGWCQNFAISQASYDAATTRHLETDEAIRIAGEYGSMGIAYTYNEPLINFESIAELAPYAAERGYKNVLVTNGYINEEPLMELLPHINAANIDIKFFRDELYRKHCSGRLGPVMRTVEILLAHGKHVELTMLLIPGLNDDSEQIKDLVDWISALSEDIPLHLSRYYPAYKMDVPATPYLTLVRARAMALKKLHYVYVGNVYEEACADTICPHCNKTVIERKGYRVLKIAIADGACVYCKGIIPVVQ